MMIGVLAAAPASAQMVNGEKEWSVSFAAYGWLLSLDGSATVGGNTADVDVPFKTIIENLDGGVMAQLDVRYARFGAFVNGVYGRVTADERVPFGASGFEAAVDTRITFIDFGVSYAFDPVSLGTSGSSSVSLAPYVGGRYTDVDLKVDLGGLRSETDIGFTDPILGVRSEWDFGPQWSAALRGDIGGFGIGSDFSWHMLVVAGYRFGLFANEDARAFFGYRVLGQDYSSGSGDARKGWDVITHGPILGLQVTY